MADTPYMNQEGLRDFFKELTGTRADTNTIRKCLLNGLPYVQIGQRKLFCRDSVLEWLKKGEVQSPTYTTLRKERR